MNKKITEEMESVVDSTPFKKKAKDWVIQGLQLQRGYLEHWELIKDTSKYYGVDMNRLGPVITKQAHDQIIIAKELTEKIKKDKEIRAMAEMCTFPIRSIFYDGDDPEKTVDGIIFLMVFRALTDFCVNFSKDKFLTYLQNGNSKDSLKKIFSVKGFTIKETEDEIRRAVIEMIADLK